MTLKVQASKRNLRIIITDTGVGIPKQELPLLFQEFTQAQHYATREYGGVGLGLCIVHHLVQLMQGSITVESKVGVGTSMAVTLPLHEA